MTNNRGGIGARARRDATRRERFKSQYGAIQPSPYDLETSGGRCSQRFTGAGYACHCGIAWDTGDERPPCPQGRD